MNPPTQFCHNPHCPARGQRGKGNIRVHSYVEQRYRCTRCGHTFAATTGTPFYRLRTAADVVTLVLTLLCHGCPLQAIVAAFGVDERTVAAWLVRAGHHSQQMHQHIVQQGCVDIQHVQADELWVKLVGRRMWMAMALAAPSRLWLGGVISSQRDLVLITTLMQMVRTCARTLAMLVCVDGLASYITACLRVFRDPVRTGRRGRPRLVLEAGLLLGQVVKRYVQRRVVSVERRVVRGTAEAIAAVLEATGSGTGINTAYIERLNATFRASLAPLVRRGRAIAHTETTLTAGMYLVGCAYNFCWLHESLRVAAPAGAPWKWQERTPAMAAGLTDHRWTMRELLRSQVPLPLWVAPKRRGRPPKRALQPAMAVAA
jgi:transposase-like protein